LNIEAVKHGSDPCCAATPTGIYYTIYHSLPNAKEIKIYAGQKAIYKKI